jgi:hypothetical protein
MRVMARTGEGRGPYLPYRNNGLSPNNTSAKPKKFKKPPQNEYGNSRKSIKNSYLPPKISYKNQSDIMKSIFGNKNLPPRKLANVYNHQRPPMSNANAKIRSNSNINKHVKQQTQAYERLEDHST